MPYAHPNHSMKAGGEAVRALIVKEFRELARDRRTLAMLVVLPVILLTIFGYAANFSVERIRVAVVGPVAAALAEELKSSQVARDSLEIVRVDPRLGRAAGVNLLRAQDAHAVIFAMLGPDPDAPRSERMRVMLDGSSLFTAQTGQGVFVQLAAEDARERVAAAVETAEESLSEASAAAEAFERFGAELTEYLAAIPGAIGSGQAPGEAPIPPERIALPDLPELTPPTLDPEELTTVLFNPDLKTSWVMVPGLIGLILLFVGALITSIGLVRERESGTLEQLAVMPLRPSSIILGKIIPYFLLAILDMGAVTGLGAWIFGVPFVGSPWLFGAAGLVFLFVVLGVGVLISSVSQNTGQAIQLAILFVVPQVLLSGLIFPLESMPVGVRWIGYALPLTWFQEVSQGVLVRGAGLDSLWLPVVIVTVMAVVVFGSATARMRVTLTRGGTRG